MNCMSCVDVRLRAQVELNLLEAEAQFGVSMDGLSVESFELSPGTAMDDFYLVLGHAGRRIAGRLEYNAEAFSAATASRFAADWQVLSPLRSPLHPQGVPQLSPPFTLMCPSGPPRGTGLPLESRGSTALVLQHRCMEDRYLNASRGLCSWRHG